MKQALLDRARALGFDACRVVEGARPPPHAAEWREWLAQGRHGGMTYLERTADKRADPTLVLPGVRSIVLLAASYHLGPEPAAAPAADAVPRGVIARYARHADYHEVLAPALRELSQFIDRQGPPDTRSIWYTDTGPVLERDLAQRAGLGFVGKHTNLIGRSLGNWFLLAEILTTAEIEPDGPEPNRCGHCTRCLSACPTSAITAPFQLDARRCISYLTIELKGSIPEELRPAIGRRIFGCDDCLEVCPWNRFAREGRLLREHRRPELDGPGLTDLLSLSPDAFKRRFAGTPLERPKRRGLLRNVAVALGNVADRSALRPCSGRPRTPSR
jgi:epoxyqueuosine reductase